MKLDRIADIPIRHRFVSYVCRIGYSEYDADFKFVSARYADPTKTQTPPNGFDLFLRILHEPALRATMLEALTPSLQGQITELREKAVSERGKNLGFALGFAALLFVGYVLYRITLLLSRYIGHDWAELVTYLPAFFAFVVIFPVQTVVERWHARRYCEQHSHRLETFKDKGGTEVTWCRRCGLRYPARTNEQ